MQYSHKFIYRIYKNIVKKFFVSNFNDTYVRCREFDQGMCLQLPDKVRIQPERRSPDETMLSLLAKLRKPPPDSNNAFAFKNTTLNKQPLYLESTSDMTSMLKNVYDWQITFSTNSKGSSDLRMFIGMFLAVTFST